MRETLWYSVAQALPVLSTNWWRWWRKPQINSQYKTRTLPPWLCSSPNSNITATFCLGARRTGLSSSSYKLRRTEALTLLCSKPSSRNTRNNTQVYRSSGLSVRALTSPDSMWMWTGLLICATRMGLLLSSTMLVWLLMSILISMDKLSSDSQSLG